MIAPNAVTVTTSAVQTPKLHIAGPLWGNPPVIVRHLDTPVSSSLKRKCIFILASLKFALSDEMFIKMTFPFPWRRDNVMCNLVTSVTRFYCNRAYWIPSRLSGHDDRLHSTFMMTSSNGNIFRVIGPLCGEFTGHRGIPLTKASDAELWCFLWSAPEHTGE